MHEISLAAEILHLIEQAREKDPFEQVKYLRLESGALSGVDVSALRFAIDSMAPGTCLADAVIEIDETPAIAWCTHCSHRVQMRDRLDTCPQCGSAQVQPEGGTELRVLELRVV